VSFSCLVHEVPGRSRRLIFLMGLTSFSYDRRHVPVIKRRGA
jgi:hypothetical protein